MSPPPSTSTDLDTTKLATESSEHEVFITHFAPNLRSSHPRLFHQHHWHLLALLFCMVTLKNLKKKQVREWSYFLICFFLLIFILLFIYPYLIVFIIIITIFFIDYFLIQLIFIFFYSSLEHLEQLKMAMYYSKKAWKITNWLQRTRQ